MVYRGYEEVIAGGISLNVVSKRAVNANTAAGIGTG
jgi:hypothetical protein